MWCDGFFSDVPQETSQVNLLTSKETTSQNKAFCTSPQWNIYLFIFSMYFSLIFFGVNFNPSYLLGFQE